jgi:hypothetical protein
MTPADEARFIALWQAGTVASAVRMIAKAEMTGTIGRILPTLDNSEEILIGKLTSEEGIGWPMLRLWVSRYASRWYDLADEFPCSSFVYESHGWLVS